MRSGEHSPLTIGIEEEVFLLEPERPSLSSLFYLLKLEIQDPVRYFFHTASNFARGKDLRYSIMSGAEISTGIHSSAGDAVLDLAKRRTDLIAVVQERAFIFAAGHPVDADVPTNTCALQFHIGCKGQEREVWKKLAYFAPVLALLTANSPLKDGKYFGMSYRMHSSFAIGPVTEDPYYRYQDVIISRRLGTVEVRVFDPIWDLERIERTAQILLAVAGSRTESAELDRRKLTGEREDAATLGMTAPILKKIQELSNIIPVHEDEFKGEFALQTMELFERHGKLGMYAVQNDLYRASTRAYVVNKGSSDRAAQEDRPIEADRSSDNPSDIIEAGPHTDRINVRRTGRYLRAVVGIMFYYVPRIPYLIYKYLKERPAHRSER